MRGALPHAPLTPELFVQSWPSQWFGTVQIQKDALVWLRIAPRVFGFQRKQKLRVYRQDNQFASFLREPLDFAAIESNLRPS